MARGWESKSVESQIDDARSSRETANDHRTAEEMARINERESLELSRTRVKHDLDQAKNPRYEAILRQALAHLDRRLAELQ